MFRISTHGLVGTVFVLLSFLLATPGMAGTLITDGSGFVVGIEDLDVNGTTYDVSFCDGSFNDFFGDLNTPHNQPEFWLDVNGAGDAAAAIQTALGLTAETYAGADNFIVPFGINGVRARTKNVQNSTAPGFDASIFQSSRNPAVDLPAPYVVFEGQCPGLIYDGGGLVSGIKGLNVNGQGMDVTFCRDSFVNLFGDINGPFNQPEYWGSSSAAATAAAAIELALGSTGETATGQDNFYVPFGKSGNDVNTQNTAPSSSPSIDNGVDQGGRNPASVLSAPYAVFGTSCPGLTYDSGLVSGIRSLDVAGADVDVTFCHDSFNNLFGDLSAPFHTPEYWGSSSGAVTAAAAIELALGSSGETAPGQDNFYVPFGQSGNDVNTQNTAPSSNPAIDSGVDQGGRNPASVLSAPYAVFGTSCPGLVVSGGVVTEIRGVELMGEEIDLHFCHDSFNNLFGSLSAPSPEPLFWGSVNDARDAAEIIELALGDSAETAPNKDNFYVPFGQSGNDVNTQNTAPSSSPSVDNGVDQGGRNPASVLDAPFVQFGMICP